MDEIAMGTVHFANVEARSIRAFRGISKSLGNRRNIVERHLDRLGHIWCSSQGARRDTGPWSLAALRIFGRQGYKTLHGTVRSGASAAVPKLNSRNSAQRAEEVRDPGIAIDLLLIPNACTVVGFAPSRLNGRFLGKYDSGAAQCHSPEMHEMPLIRTTVI